MQIVLVSALLHNACALLKHRLSKMCHASCVENPVRQDIERAERRSATEGLSKKSRKTFKTESAPIRAKGRSTIESLPMKDGEVFWSFKNKVIETSKGALLKVLK